MILHGLATLGLVRIAQVPLAITHNEQDLDAFSIRPALEVAQVGLVLGLLHEELVDQLDSLDAVVAPGGFREVQMIQFLSKKRFVQRPFGQRDLHGRFLGGSQPTRDGWQRCAGDAQDGKVLQKNATRIFHKTWQVWVLSAERTRRRGLRAERKGAGKRRAAAPWRRKPGRSGRGTACDNRPHPWLSISPSTSRTRSWPAPTLRPGPGG